MYSVKIPRKITKKLPSRARLEHERLASLINSMADGVIALDERINIAIYNGAAINILDINTLTKGTSLGRVMHPIDSTGNAVDIEELVRSTKVPTENRELRLKYSDGSLVNLYINIAPVHLGYGRKGQKGFVLLLRDITREKSLEEERDEFISVISHELRTPIAISEGNVSNAQFIADKSGDIEEIRKALRETHTQIMFLSEMVNDLSTLSRAERGKLTAEIEPINVHELVTELGKSYQPSAEAKDLKLIAEADPSLELLYSARLYVLEILQNFVTNAIKYTEKGHVTISAMPHDKGVVFQVSDTGIGISKGDQERVFDKFFRSEDFRTRSNNGTGLGLYVTLKLATMLKAEISLKSELNKGSTFTIFMPNLNTTD